MMAVNTPPANTTPLTSSPPLSATGTGGANTPLMKPVLAPISTGANLHRDDSSSSGEMIPPRLSTKSSVDRLRSEALSFAGSDRAPSPSSMQPPSSGPGSDTGDGSSTRPSSPHTSFSGYPSGSGSQTASSPLQRNSQFLPTIPMGSGNRSSMGSISSRYLHVGPAGGAPHQGRPINLSMPRPLAGGGEGSYGRNSMSGLDIALDGGRGHQRMSSRGTGEGSCSARSRLSMDRDADMFPLLFRLWTKHVEYESTFKLVTFFALSSDELSSHKWSKRRREMIHANLSFHFTNHPNAARI